MARDKAAGITSKTQCISPKSSSQGFDKCKTKHTFRCAGAQNRWVCALLRAYRDRRYTQQNSKLSIELDLARSIDVHHNHPYVTQSDGGTNMMA